MHRSVLGSKLAEVFMCIALLWIGYGARDAAARTGSVKSDSEVKITASATKPDGDGKQMITITMIHNKDWHTYANPVGNEDLASNQTKVTITAKQKPTSVKIDYPPGHP